MGILLVVEVYEAPFLLQGLRPAMRKAGRSLFSSPGSWLRPASRKAGRTCSLEVALLSSFELQEGGLETKCFELASDATRLAQGRSHLVHGLAVSPCDLLCKNI